jgi:hypothetical protein
MISSARDFISALQRIGLWFGSLLFSVTLFSLLLNLFMNGPERFAAAPALLIFRVTMTFALPVWCLYLPWVIALKDAKEQRIRTILVSGILIGPASMALWGLILQLKGEGAHKVWYGDPLIGMAGGSIASIIFALIVGFLTTSVYVIAWKIVDRDQARG